MIMIPELSGAVWRKSSYSGSSGGQCVEVARNLPDVVAVRDSRDPGSGALAVTPAAWQALLACIRSGELA
jgi:hypothetical protein